jgi:hypothetical protein
MIEDYINGEINDLPEYIRLFDHYLLEAKRGFNSQLPEAERFQYYFMDVNHSKDNFISSILEIEKVLGEQSVFDDVQSQPLDSKAYQSSLAALKTKLQQEQTQWESQWGSKWYERITETVEVEIKSSEYRVNGDEKLREQIMLDNILAKMPNDPSVKALVNCGMFHAQKQTLMGESYTRLARFLEDAFPSETYSVASVGIQGERLQNFADEQPESFNLLKDTKKRDLIRIIGEEAGDKLSFLPLTDPIFQEDMVVTYTAGSKQVVPPGAQFDAIVAYPYISVLESISTYK